ncbi:hypothetical protein F7725_009509 [Dissostichus mawsoni]|uniref:SH3 domain-containing protein n=1 Tax=Dissostichus mawsoni TaxID=36200 RepID=A0A7J5XLA2_DISMA|nr:hypothetical protein F7725_009509 [Dissostichus mawsoni]
MSVRARKSEHGIFHFKTGLQKMTAKQMDGDVYDDLRGHFTLLCGTEMDTCLRTHKQFSTIWDSVAKVTRERNVLQFLQESVSFSKTPEFTFQPAPGVHSTGAQRFRSRRLPVREAKKWATKVAKDYKIITHGERALQTLESRLKLLSGDTCLSVEQKIAELSRLKAEARLALLSDCITGIEQWLHNAMTQAEEELERERRLSEQRKSTEDFSEDEFELTDFEDYDDENGDIFADPVSASGVCIYPAACRVIYNYQASQLDELSIIEGEELQVVEDGDMEDWLKVCNSCGQVGYVPERYVQFLCLPAEGASHLEGSFSSTLSSGTKEGREQRALYSYQAQSAEELSFQEGALIHLIRCRHAECWTCSYFKCECSILLVDDGFWEGELNGRVGVFPSLVVELLHDEREEEDKEEEVRLLCSLWLQRIAETHLTVYISFLTSLLTPTMPPFSPSSPSPTNPGCSSALSATPLAVRRTHSRYLQTTQQFSLNEWMVMVVSVFYPSEPEGSSHSSPDFSGGRLRPCRAPPPPPTHKRSPQP